MKFGSVVASHKVISMEDVVRISLPATPRSAGEARRLLREHARLDGMRHAEADLLVTELIANVMHIQKRIDMFKIVQRCPSRF